jgi:hypothetical protein
VEDPWSINETGIQKKKKKLNSWEMEKKKRRKIVGGHFFESPITSSFSNLFRYIVITNHFIFLPPSQDGSTPLDLCLSSGRDTRTYELIKLLKQFMKKPTLAKNPYNASASQLL